MSKAYSIQELSGNTAWKVSKYSVNSGPYFPVFGLNMESTKYLSVFSPKAGKYGPEITPYLDTFHTVKVIQWVLECHFSVLWKGQFPKLSLSVPVMVAPPIFK